MDPEAEREGTEDFQAMFLVMGRVGSRKQSHSRTRSEIAGREFRCCN